MGKPLVATELDRDDAALAQFMMNITSGNFDKRISLRNAILEQLMKLDDCSNKAERSKVFNYIATILRGAYLAIGWTGGDDAGAINALMDANASRWQLNVESRMKVVA